MFMLLWIASRKWQSTTKRIARVKGVLRATAVISFALLVLSFFSARRAHAELAKAGMKIGRDLLPLVDELGGATTVAINGQKISVTHHGTTKPVADVLDGAERACRAGGAEAPPSHDGFGVMRTMNGEDEGVVVCFAKGEHTPGSLLEQVKRLEETKDLGSLGKLRYVYAKKDAKPGASTSGTAVIAAVTDDSFRLDAMMPADDGDTPGSDDPMLPRPKGSVRFLSAVAFGTPFASRGYRTKLAPDEVETAFTDDMLARGFTSTTAVTKDGHKALGFERDGVIVVVATLKDRNGDTLVSVGSLGVDPRRSAPKPKVIE